jgi:hypothetical protein
MFVQPFYFVSYYFYWIEYDDFFFHFQETYNSRLRERYGDDPSTHPDFDQDLWMEVGSSDGPDKNRVYGLSNTMAKNLRQPVVSQSLRAPNQYRAPNLRSSWPCSNTRLISPKNKSDYRRIMNKTQLISPRNISNSRRIMNNFAKWSWTWHHRVVIHVRPLFSRMVPRTTNLLLLLLQLRHCANLIFFLEHIQFVMNIFFLFLVFNKILFA